MKRKKLLLGAMTSLIVFVIVALALPVGASSTYNPPATLYELSDDSAYGFSGASPTGEMSYGRNTMGTFSVSGNINQQSTFRNRTAYGVEDIVSFSYSYDGAYQTSTIEDWNLISDTGTTVDNIGLSVSIDKGALIIQKSSDGFTWNNAANPIVNFFGANPSGVSNFYTTSGDDIKNGTYYRIIIAYKMGRKTGTSGALFWKEDVYEYKKCVEVYEFYICINTGVISIHNLAADVSTVEQEGFSYEQIKNGETLVDHSITTKGFSIDKLGTSYLVSVSKNGETAQYVDNGATFTENGVYTISAITKLGKTVSTTVCVFNGGDNGGHDTYFGNSLVHGNRVLRYSSYPELTMYPTFARGATAVLKATDSTIPVLHGYILNTTTGEKIDVAGSHSEQTFSLDVGDYYCEFSNNESGAAGTTYQYTLCFSVLNEESGPYINYFNLMHTDRFEDLQTKHYEVAYQTAGGGYIFVCFALDEYDAALKYSYEIEKRFIEDSDDGLYYKSMENPNLKVKYFDYVEMTAALNYYAALNVEINYFNATDKFTYNTYGNDMLESLESMSLRESIKVFATASDREKLIDRQPFINHFTFIQASDCDSAKVEAYCKKNGKTYLLEYGKDVSEQLSVSSVYTITETNVYGDILTYDAVFINENTTQLDWKITYNGVTESRRITNNDMVGGTIDIIADSIEVVSILNGLDNNALIAIKAPDVYSFEIKCLLSEINDLGLYKKGRYEISVIDRLGNTFKINLTLTGKTRFSELPKTAVCFTAAYNAVYLNDKSDSEELILDVTALKNAMAVSVNPDYYTEESFLSYQSALQKAQEVYNNIDATQAELDQAATELNSAYTALVPSIARAELQVELLRYENADIEKYTSTSARKWKAAYDLGALVAQNASATSDAIQSAVDDLKLAYQALVLRGNKDNLFSVLSHAKGINCFVYTPASIEKLNDAFLSAFEVYSDIDAIQSQIDHAEKLVSDAEAALVKMADFSELQELIDSIKKIDSGDYVETSVNVLKVQFDKALIVLYNKNTAQKDVNETVATLKKAKDGLVLCGDFTALRTELQKVAQIDYFLYNYEQLSALHVQYLKACEMIEDGGISQEEIDKEKELLQTMRLSLSKSKSRQALFSVLQQIESTSMNNYLNDVAQEISDNYKASAELLFDETTSKEVIDEYAQKLKELLAKEKNK